MSEQKTSYDDVPYESYSFPQSHPDRLAVIARLFGMEPPPVERCRVLELGCASGGNLLSLAQDLPGSEFVGIDASARQVQDGRKAVEALGLKNLRLETMDIADVGEGSGTFDYIIAHGVYSWVPPETRDQIVAVCKQRLAPNGVVYISYNTYPGWHVRGIVRDMMLFHGKQFSDPPTQLAQAKALVEFVANSAPAENNPYIMLLKGELEFLGGVHASYLLHEHLEENNSPVYFHEFVKTLGAHGLQYLGESEISTMLASNFTPQISEVLHRVGAHDIVQMEQYMDFIRCRYFRQTLACHQGVPLNRALVPAVAKGFLSALPARPVNESPSLAPNVAEQFRMPNGAPVTASSPADKAALLVLAQHWPAGLAFGDLLREAEGLLLKHGLRIDNRAAFEDQIALAVLTGFSKGLVEFRPRPLRVATTAGERPRTTPLVRYQAETSDRVTNLRGEMVHLNSFQRLVLSHLDGSRDRAGLIGDIAETLRQRGSVLYQNNEPVTSPAQIKAVLDGSVNEVLVGFALTSLLQGPDEPRSATPS